MKGHPPMSPFKGGFDPTTLLRIVFKIVIVVIVKILVIEDPQFILMNAIQLPPLKGD